MTEYFIKNLIFFGLTIVVTLIFKLILSKTKFKKHEAGNVLRYPLPYRLAPLCFVGYFAVVSLLVYLFAKQDWIYAVVAGIVAVAGIVTMIVWSLWKVEIYGEEFVFRNYFGVSRKYSYADLKFREHKNGAKWFFYIGELKVFTMPFYIQNRGKLEKAYRGYIDRISDKKRG